MTNETAIVPKQWTQQDLDLIRATTAPKCDPNEFALLLYQAKTYHLDPLLRQIWAVKYDPGQPARIFVGRDGYLAIAHTSGQFDGMETEINGEGENMTATTRVYRKDASHPFTVSVKMKEYNKKSGNWVTMPETMLKKVSQVQALRQAFNISGVYAPEEIPEKELRDYGHVVEPETPEWIRKEREKEAKKKKPGQEPIVVGS